MIVKSDGENSAENNHDTVLTVSFPKMLLLSAIHMGFFFAVILYFIAIPLHDPVLFVFIGILLIGTPFVFAAGICLMLRCKVSHEGLRPAASFLFQRTLRWEDISTVRKLFGAPYYLVKGRNLGEFCILPCRFLLQHPQRLKQLIEQYAPAESVVRKYFAE